MPSRDLAETERSESERAVAPAPQRLDPFPACRLERLIGRPADTWTIDDLVAVVREQGVRVVSLMHVGGDGWLKTLDFAARDAAHLRDILRGGERADGSSLFPGLGIPAGASDVVLRPRPSGAFLDPFADAPTLAVMCGHAGRDGQPLPQSPDTRVRRADQRARDASGIAWHALGEIEFYLGRRGGGDDVYGARDGGYHAASPFLFGERLRRRALQLLAEMGVRVKYAHGEVGWVEASEAGGAIWEQHEIELGLAPLPDAADAVAIAQWVLRNLARAEGLRCSFDPILRRGHAGNGLHFHFSPVIEGANAAVIDAAGALTPPARGLIAGLVRFGGALMAFGNRAPESFLRLSQAKEAPSRVTWGEYDRNALVRLPVLATDRDGRRSSPPTIEFRLADGSAHPHELLAGIAQALVRAGETADVEALLERTRASAPRAGDGERVPRSFAEVAGALERDRAVFEAGGVFPAGLIDATLAQLRGRARGAAPRPAKRARVARRSRAGAPRRSRPRSAS